ncbi:MAG: endonuclease III [Bacilli bacterium]|nr:endonuclease III [Bacilli bacterium]
MEKSEAKYILDTLKKEYPEAKCELEYRNNFELLIAVSLSAQTTDKRVNVVTKDLFKKYDDPYKLKDADYEEVKEIIKSLGLSSSKARNIIDISKKLVEDYKGKVPSTREELMLLPGVGRKTSNVVLSVGFDIPAIAVDTHVKRVSNRLGLSESDDVLKIEEDLMKLFDEKDYYSVHHSLIFFGRYLCKAKNPDCNNCILKDKCKIGRC